MAEILNAHGSRNDIFVTPLRPGDFASGPDLRAFVQNLCDRGGPFGGDGVYFYDATRPVPEAWFFNPDGTAAEFCGNGMRCLGRVILDQRGIETAEIRSGAREYTVRRGATTPEGVRQVRLEHPAVDFAPEDPVVTGRNPAIQARLPELDPALAFTAVTIPNPHLVAVVDKYVEADLVAMGEQVAARRDLFPAGANLSVLLPLVPPGVSSAEEVFVRTFERGAGLTASCGSGMAAARAVYSRIGRADPEREVLIRNAGGMATAALRVRDGRWLPVLEGNATFVYRADVDPPSLARTAPARTAPFSTDREHYPDEIRAYAALDDQNAARLRAVGLLRGLADDQRARADRYGQRPARRDDLAVDLPRQVGGGGDLHPPGLEPFQRPALTAAPGQDPGRRERPAERTRGREDAHVEPPVVQPGLGQQHEASRQQACVPDHHAPRPPSQRLASVQAHGELSRWHPQMGQAGHGVRDPAEPAFVRAARRLHHGRVQPEAGHGGEADPVVVAQVRQGQVDHAVPTAQARVDRRAGPGRNPQRPRGQVRGAERDDGQRDAGPGHGLRAGPDGAVTPRREHQCGPRRNRLAGQSQATVGRAGLGEHRIPARRLSRVQTAPPEPAQVADERPVDHERHGRHGPLCSGTAPRSRARPRPGSPRAGRHRARRRSR